MDLDATKKAFDMIHDMQRKQADLMDRVRPAYHEPIPIYDRWGWLRTRGGDVIGTINDRSGDPTAWLIVALIIALCFLLPRSEPKPLTVSVPAVAGGTVSGQRLKKDGTWETFINEPAKELPDGKIQTQDGRIWVKNPDGTLSEVK